MPFIRLKKVPSIPGLLSVFNDEKVLGLSNAFYLDDRVVFGFYSIDMGVLH